MKERILIMEDETAIQAVLYELLTDTGYGAYWRTEQTASAFFCDSFPWIENPDYHNQGAGGKYDYGNREI